MNTPAYTRSNKHFSARFCPDTVVGNPEHRASRVGLRYFHMIVLLLLIMLLAACDKESNEYRQEAAHSSEQWVKETQQTFQALKNYALQRQKEFRRQTEAELARYEERIDKFRAEIESASAEAKRKFNEINEEWNKKAEDLKQQLEEIKTASAEAWQHAERRINAGMEELRKLYERARSAFS
jgi:DNA anti-recombination protein RmuC